MLAPPRPAASRQTSSLSISSSGRAVDESRGRDWSIADTATRTDNPDRMSGWPVPPQRASLLPQHFSGAQSAVSEGTSDPFDPLSSRLQASEDLHPSAKVSADIPALWSGFGEGITLRATPQRVIQEKGLDAVLHERFCQRHIVPEDGDSSHLETRRHRHVSLKSHRGELMNTAHPALPYLIGREIAPLPLATPSSSGTRLARRETDPKMAIDPTRRRSHTYPLLMPSPVATPTTPDSPVSLYTDRSRSLFFATPLQSPTSSGSFPSPRKGSFSPPSLKSLRQSHLSIILHGHRHLKRQTSGSKRKSDQSPGERRNVMGSLRTVKRDAGFDLDPGSLGLRASELESVRKSQGSEYSLEELPSGGEA